MEIIIHELVRISKEFFRLSFLLLMILLIASGTVKAASIKVAFTGDQGVGSNAKAVLSLIANEDTDLLLIQGDLGYVDGAAIAWEENLTNALGENFPVLALVGNHENYEWPVYQQLIQQRIERSEELSCSGVVGVKALCRYGSIEIVQVAPGIHVVEGVLPNDNYAQFIESSFADSNSPWKICAWHKNQSKLQTGGSSNATGWEIYNACLNAGSMIALAHEHAYSRTHLLSSFERQTVVHEGSDMTIEPGHSFAFVSGLGGKAARQQEQSGPWWASIYTATQKATQGALFCDFDGNIASCYFKAIDGAVPDQFVLRSNSPAIPEPLNDITRINDSNTTNEQDLARFPDLIPVLPISDPAVVEYNEFPNNQTQSTSNSEIDDFGFEETTEIGSERTSEQQGQLTTLDSSRGTLEHGSLIILGLLLLLELSRK